MTKLSSKACLKILHDIKLIPFRCYKDHVYFYWHPLPRLGWKELFIFEKDGDAYALMYCIDDYVYIASMGNVNDVDEMVDVALGFWIFEDDPIFIVDRI